MNSFYKHIIYILIISITSILIFNSCSNRTVYKLDINIDSYIYKTDSINKIIHKQQIEIDSLNKVKSKIIIKYETLYNYMLIADNDSIISYISKKIYSRE